MIFVNKDVRRISEAAMMSAIVGVILILNRQMANILEFAIYWILTFPILLYTVKYGVRNALLPSIAMLVLSFIISLPTTTFYLMSSLVIGVIYGYGINHKWHNIQLLASSIFFTFLSYLITTVFFAAVFGYSIQEDIELINEMIRLFQVNIPGGNTSFVMIVIVLSTVLMSFLQALCIHLFAIMLLKRLRIKSVEVKTFMELYLPKWLGYVSTIIWLLFLGVFVVKLDRNITTILIILAACDAIVAIGYGSITIMSYFVMKRKRKLVFLLPVMLFIPPINIVVMGIGILDMIFNLKVKMKEGILYGKN